MEGGGKFTEDNLKKKKFRANTKNLKPNFFSWPKPSRHPHLSKFFFLSKPATSESPFISPSQPLHPPRDLTTAPTVSSPRVQPFLFVFFFPSTDQRTHQPLCLSISSSSFHLQV